MQQHCLYWDPDGDGVIWPIDTWRGFRDLGFNLLFTLLATIVLHASLSLPTRSAFVDGSAISNAEIHSIVF